MASAMGTAISWVGMARAPSEHPDFGHLILLVFEAVLEVVFVSVPGYIMARAGMFDAEAQKFVANLNVMVFTPCLSTAPLDHIH
jgi:auxin efflux carrier family protein